MKKARNRKERFSLLRASIVALTLCFWTALTVFAQSPDQTTSEGNRLPPTTGDPLTIKPVDMQDLDCMIAQWNAGASRPTLTIICPPEAVFAPLRVLIKLSWMKPELAPTDPGKLPFRAGALTKIRTNKDAAQIWLLAGRAHGVQEEWVAFDAVGDIALLVGHPGNKSAKKISSSTDRLQSRDVTTNQIRPIPSELADRESALYRPHVY
jgi:hypothetical protein